MSAIAIITARGGSKRVPRKNIRDFLGLPIITYSIRAAIQCQAFDEVMVSTDDHEIAAISVAEGANVPFLRSAKNSDDFSSTSDVISEVLREYKNREKEFSLGCCIYPTAPFINPTRLLETRDLLINNDYDTIFPVTRFPAKAQRALFSENERISMLWPEFMDARSQDLPETYYDAGQFYWFQVQRFLKEGELFTSNSGTYILDPMEVQDIDDEKDWLLAETKFRINNGLCVK